MPFVYYLTTLKINRLDFLAGFDRVRRSPHRRDPVRSNRNIVLPNSFSTHRTFLISQPRYAWAGRDRRFPLPPTDEIRGPLAALVERRHIVSFEPNATNAKLSGYTQTKYNHHMPGISDFIWTYNFPFNPFFFFFYNFSAIFLFFLLLLFYYWWWMMGWGRGLLLLFYL